MTTTTERPPHVTPLPFITARVAETDRNAGYDVPGQVTSNEHLAVIARIDAAGRLAGATGLMHLPTGHFVFRGTPADCWQLADDVAGADWSFTDPTAVPEETEAATRAAVRRLRMTKPSSVELPAHPPVRADGRTLKRAALPLMADVLAAYQWAFNRTGGGPGSVPSSIPDPDQPGKTMINPEWTYLIHKQVDDYAIAYLLGALHAVDPEIADSAAAALADAWDSGDSMGEWVWQWAQELADGRPLTLPGVPTAQPGDLIQP